MSASAPLIPPRSTWQSLHSGKLVTVERVYESLEAVKVRYSSGAARTLSIDEFVSRYRHESEIRP